MTTHNAGAHSPDVGEKRGASTERLFDLAAGGAAQVSEGLLEDLAGDLEIVTANGPTSLRAVLADARRAAGAGDAAGAVQTLAALATEALRAGSLELAAAICATAQLHLRLVAGEGAQAGEATLVNVAGLIALYGGRPDLALEPFSRAASLAGDVHDRELERAALLNVANTHRMLGQPALAIEPARRALQTAQTFGDQYHEAQLGLTLSNIALELDDVDSAVAAVTAVEPVVRRLREPGLTASLHGAQGLVAARLGNHGDAEWHFRAALQAARRARDLDKITAALQDLAASADESGRPALAMRRLRRAVDAANAAGSLARQRELLVTLARAEYASGARAAAGQRAEHALDIAERVGIGVAAVKALLAAFLISPQATPRDGELALSEFETAIPQMVEDGAVRDIAEALHNAIAAGVLAEDVARAERLVRQHQQAVASDAAAALLLTLARAFGDDQSGNGARSAQLVAEAIDLVPAERRAWMGAVTAAGLRESRAGAQAAEPAYRAALEAAGAAGQHDLALHCSNDLALALDELGRTDEALQLLEKGRTEARHLGNRVAEQRALHNIAEMTRRRGEVVRAVEAATQSVELAIALDDPALEADARAELGLALSSSDDPDDAREQFARVLSGHSTSRFAMALAKGGLAGLELHAGRGAEAARLYREALELDDRSLQMAEDLLGLCEAFAASGDRRRYRAALQRFVRLVQREGLERLAGELGRSAVHWRRAEAEGLFAETLATAVLLAAGRASQDATSPEVIAEMMWPVLFRVAIALPERGRERRQAQGALLEALSQSISRRSARTLVAWVKAAQKAVADPSDS